MTSPNAYHRIKTVLLTLQESLPPYTPSAEQIQLWQSRLQAKDIPLSDGDFPAHWAADGLTAIFASICNKALTEEEAQGMIAAYWNDQSLSLAASRHSMDEAILTMYVHLACQWALSRLAATLAVYAPCAHWDHSHCPTCGGAPMISYFSKDNGSRHLVCGACQTSWRFRRIGCPFCGEENHEQLRTLEAEEYPGWTVMVCQTCRGAIKTGDLRNLAEKPDWNEVQLTLLPLDFAVAKWLNDEPKKS